MNFWLFNKNLAFSIAPQANINNFALILHDFLLDWILILSITCFSVLMFISVAVKFSKT